MSDWWYRACMVNDANNLIDEIRRVFANSKYPGDSNLISKPTHSDEPYATEKDFISIYLMV